MDRVRTSVAAFNLHVGIDGYGRPYDVVDACGALDADILLLSEMFAPEGGPSQAEEVAATLGYRARIEHALFPARRLREPPSNAPSGSWEPNRPYRHTRRALRFGGGRSDPASGGGYETGTWGLAVLSREAITSHSVIQLGQLPKDVPRAAVVVSLASGLTVVGTHMSHFTRGSLLHFLRLRSHLPSPEGPCVLGGDMNFWGPPVSLLLPGWRRAVVGASWPSWRPRHQLDHLFVTRSVSVEDGAVLRTGNSDHLPVRSVVSFPRPSSSLEEGPR